MNAKTHTLGDDAIEERHRRDMNTIAGVLDEHFNGSRKDRTVGFALLIFPFNDHDGHCNYISNARREDIIKLMKDQIAKLEAPQPGKDE